MQRMSYSFILKGSKVEVSSDEDGYQNAWFPATVLDPPTPSPRTRPKRTTKARVRYDHMLSDDAGELLVEKLKVTFIRPIPPKDDPPAGMEPYDVVDVFYDEIWWTGYVVEVGNDVYTVAFKSPPDVLEVGRSELRPHWDWVDSCYWVRPAKEAKSTSFFSPAMQVELDPTKDNPGSTWLPSVYLGEDKCDGLHMVKYKSSEDEHVNDFQKILVHIDQIRPCPPIVKKKDFDLLEKVDALVGCRWNVGVITKIVVGKSRYTVSFRHLNKEVEFDYSEIRPHMDWIDGQWVSKLKRKLSREVVRENHNQGTSAEKIETPSKSELRTFSRRSTPKRNWLPESKFQSPQSSARGANVVPGSELSEVNNEISEFSNEDVIEEVADQRICEPVVQGCDPKASDEETFEPITDENAVRAGDKEFEEPNDDFEGLVGPEDVMEADAESDNNGMRCETNQEYEHPDMTTQNLQAQKEIDNKTSKAVFGAEDCMTEKQETNVLACSELTGNGTSEVVVSIGELLTLVSSYSKATDSQDQVSTVSTHVSADGRLGTEETNSPENANDSVVQKRHCIWRFLESMDVFRKLPQSPHFRPLLKYSDKERESLAIGSMVNYSNLMANISVLQPSDSTQHIDSLISQLGGYAELGFDVNTVQGQLNIWSNTKAEIERLKAERKGITSGIKERIEEKAKINEEVVAVNHRISELSRKRAALAQVRMEQRAKLVKSSLEAEAIRIDLESARERSRNLLASIIPR